MHATLVRELVKLLQVSGQSPRKTNAKGSEHAGIMQAPASMFAKACEHAKACRCTQQPCAHYPARLHIFTQWRKGALPKTLTCTAVLSSAEVNADMGMVCHVLDPGFLSLTESATSHKPAQLRNATGGTGSTPVPKACQEWWQLALRQGYIPSLSHRFAEVNAEQIWAWTVVCQT